MHLSLAFPGLTSGTCKEWCIFDNFCAPMVGTLFSLETNMPDPQDLFDIGQRYIAVKIPDEHVVERACRHLYLLHVFLKTFCSSCRCTKPGTWCEEKESL